MTDYDREEPPDEYELLGTLFTPPADKPLWPSTAILWFAIILWIVLFILAVWAFR